MQATRPGLQGVSLILQFPGNAAHLGVRREFVDFGRSRACVQTQTDDDGPGKPCSDELHVTSPSDDELLDLIEEPAVVMAHGWPQL